MDGTGTPWNYLVTKHDSIDVELMAKRMSKSPGIGIPSPTETVHSTIQGSKIEIRYGRPSMRGRKNFGGIVPYDSIWRTGANSSTIIALEENIRFGGETIPKGKYSIYTVPGKLEGKLIFNTDLPTFPTVPDLQKNYAVVPLQVNESKDIVEQVTIEIQENSQGGLIRMLWDKVVAFTNFEVEQDKNKFMKEKKNGAFLQFLFIVFP